MDELSKVHSFSLMYNNLKATANNGDNAHFYHHDLPERSTFA